MKAHGFRVSSGCRDCDWIDIEAEKSAVLLYPQKMQPYEPTPRRQLGNS